MYEATKLAYLIHARNTDYEELYQMGLYSFKYFVCYREFKIVVLENFKSKTFIYVLENFKSFNIIFK